jgi:phage terminase large subunit-like protein
MAAPTKALAPVPMTREHALSVLANTLGKQIQETVAKKQTLSLVDFAHTKFYIPETQAPIQLLPHQISILNYALSEEHNYQTIVYSTIKKSGKTAIAALVARYIAETWGKAEVLSLANDLEQARGRVYAKALESIELTPGYSLARRELVGVWKIIERDATYLPTGSIIRAVSSDYRGEAGSNASATLWSELWGYSSEASKRLWDELTPVPTRKRSIRYIETYAGFTDESELLLEVYNLGMAGRRLTHDDIDWPFPDQPPIWINERARMFMYWDTNVVARRMPWQTEEYYQAQEATLRPLAFRRLHLNEWSSSISSFIPEEWWIACKGDVPPLNNTTPVVMAVDAAVSSDCCAIAIVSRDPKNPVNVMLRGHKIWQPTSGHPMDLQIVEDYIREYTKTHNVVEIAYDAYQLHKLMTDLRKDAIAWCKPFSQAGDRAVADKQLYDVIRDRRITQYGAQDAYEHIRNAAAKQNKDEDTRLRIIKKAASQKIDFAVALSMAVYECLRLNL